MAVKVEIPAKRSVGIAATVILFVLAGDAGCVNLTLPRELGERDAPGFGVDPSRARPEPAGVDAGSSIQPPDRERVPDAAPDLGVATDSERDPPSGGGEKLVNGRPCAEGSQCGSGQCVDGVCCASACPGACQACNVEGSAGTCMPVPAGQDPDNECAEDPPAGCQRDGACDGSGGCRLYPAGVECKPGRCEGATEYGASVCDGKGICRAGSSKSCAPNVCTGNSCGARCTQPGDCQTGFYCAAGTCQPRLARGKDCTAASQCQSGNCADGVCCDLPCTQGCYTCALPSSRGTCQPAPAGQDPRAQCPAQSATTCGRQGGCDGRGTCRLHSRGTTCTSASCANGTASAPGTCNGLGTCIQGAKKDCGAYACNGSVCGTTCGAANQCKPGLACNSGVCSAPVTLPPPPDAGMPMADAMPMPPMPDAMPPPAPRGAVLRWKMDEASGTMALDSSGNNRHGSYVGTVGAPAVSMMVPPVMFPNPRSREFDRADAQYARLSNIPAALRPTAEITIALWYRATTVDGSDPGSRAAAELVSGSSAYILRLLDTDIEILKRVQVGAGIDYARCYGPLANPLDGQWHHVAGVSSAAGLKVYIDGVEKCSNTQGQPIAYDANIKDLWVGRYRDPEGGYLFQGNLDDVRIYDRALAPTEIARLASGAE
jgi:hypothetical protein